MSPPSGVMRTALSSSSSVRQDAWSVVNQGHSPGPWYSDFFFGLSHVRRVDAPCPSREQESRWPRAPARGHVVRTARLPWPRTPVNRDSLTRRDPPWAQRWLPAARVDPLPHLPGLRCWHLRSRVGRFQSRLEVQPGSVVTHAEADTCLLLSLRSFIRIPNM